MDKNDFYAEVQLFFSHYLSCLKFCIRPSVSFVFMQDKKMKFLSKFKILNGKIQSFCWKHAAFHCSKNWRVADPTFTTIPVFFVALRCYVIKGWFVDKNWFPIEPKLSSFYLLW